jgi:hypothetical protein
VLASQPTAYYRLDESSGTRAIKKLVGIKVAAFVQAALMPWGSLLFDKATDDLSRVMAAR